MKTTITTVACAITLFVSASAQAAPSSGMLLGVYAFPNYQGLRVTGTIHGYSAHGKLFRGDVLKRVTADGLTVYPTRSHGQIEYAKDQIGPFQPAALEVFRPGVGFIYLWVEFQPVGGVAAYSVDSTPQPQQYKARIFTEKEKPGAALLFKKQQKPNSFPLQPQANAGPGGGSGSAASLFRN